MQKYFLFLLVIFDSCQSMQNKPQTALPPAGSKGMITQRIAAAQLKPTLEDFFADSSNIGRKSHNKIEIAWYSFPDSEYVVTRFYVKQPKGWSLKNEFKLRKDQYLDPNPDVSDLNGDGFNDVTFASLRAARGANDVRTLFVYDPKNDGLIYVKNSEDYPNMQYNKELHCIDAFLVSGCCTTVFLRLEKDSLREFADVDRCDSLIVTTYDRKGKEKVILAKKADRTDFTRYENYMPLKAYGE